MAMKALLIAMALLTTALSTSSAQAGMSIGWYYDRAPYACYFRVGRCYGTGLYWSGYPNIWPGVFWGSARFYRHSAPHRAYRVRPLRQHP
jgi:hypothetical protein